MTPGIYKLSDLTGPNGAGVRGGAVIAAVAAAIAAVFTVHFLTRYFRRGNLRPFGVYCVLFGLAMVIYNAEFAPAAPPRQGVWHITHL